MLRYRKERHLDLLRERLASVSKTLPNSAPEKVADVDVAPDEREELMRRLMVGHLGQRRRGERPDPKEFKQTLDAYLACCDPNDLRQVDVLHNLHENASAALSRDEAFELPWRGYVRLLRIHMERLAAGQIRDHGVSLGDPATIAPNHTPLRVLLLADNFVSGSRSWRRLTDSAAVHPRLLFCNNLRQHPSVHFFRLAASVARLVVGGGARLAVSMLRSRPHASTRPLVHPSNTAWLRHNAFDVGLHNMGVIYRQETIASFRLGILNAHIGHLPGMRGRSVLEWSLVFGVAPCISTFFIDEGIDTGTLIVDRYPPPSETFRSAPSLAVAKGKLFDLDGFCYERALARLVRGGDGVRNAPPGPRLYVMSGLLSGSITSG